MNQYKWDQKVKAERERNKAKKAELLAKFAAPKPSPETWFTWGDLEVKPLPDTLTVEFKIDTKVWEVSFAKMNNAMQKMAEQIQTVSYSWSGIAWGGEHPTVTALAGIVPAIRTARAKCPQCTKGMAKSVLAEASDMPLSSAIVHLNDKHRWTREQIADWLDTLEIDLTIQPKEQQQNADTRADEKDDYAKLKSDWLTGNPGLSFGFKKGILDNITSLT